MAPSDKPGRRRVTLPERPIPSQKSFVVTETALRGLVDNPNDWAELEGQLTRDWSTPDFSEGPQKDEVAERVGGRYRIVEPMATGGMGRVYRVVHHELGKTFALKIIAGDLAQRPDMVEAFLQEARTLSLLDHPNIVAVTDFGQDPKHGAYLVMEYLRGETLDERLLRVERLGIAFSLQVALQVAEALHSMHSQHLIHCDIKPENVFLVRPPRQKRQRPVVKLIDFGLTRSLVTEGLGGRAALGGTPEFSAPEQHTARTPHPAMDVYAVGTLLYESITGQLPFDGTPEQIIAWKTTREPPSPSQHTEEPLPDALEQLLCKALSLDPGARQASMERLVFELRTVMDMLDLQRPDAPRRAARTTRPLASVQKPDKAPASRRRPRRIASPFPRFRVDATGRIRMASRSFGRLMSCSVPELIDRTLAEIRLGNIYPTILDELAEASAQGAPLQRTIAFQTARDGLASVLVWLIPRLDAQEVIGFDGIVVPVNPTPPG